MEQLTKTERLVAYRMLKSAAVKNKEAIETIGGGCHAGLCSLIEKELGLGLCIDMNAPSKNAERKHMKDVFPELWDNKPVTTRMYWFPISTEGWEQRIALLDMCIKKLSSSSPKIDWS